VPGDIIRVIDAPADQWDFGVVRARGVCAHRVKLLGDQCAGGSGESFLPQGGRLLDLGVYAARGHLRIGADLPLAPPAQLIAAALASASDTTAAGPCAHLQPRLGEVVWARMKTYPWWPGMIACHPKSLKWWRKGQGEGSHGLQFLVIFFGDYTHRYIDVGSLAPFQRRSFDEFCGKRSSPVRWRFSL
jgi:hypothetical protein